MVWEDGRPEEEEEAEQKESSGLVHTDTGTGLLVKERKEKRPFNR